MGFVDEEEKEEASKHLHYKLQRKETNEYGEVRQKVFKFNKLQVQTQALRYPHDEKSKNQGEAEAEGRGG